MLFNVKLFVIKFWTKNLITKSKNFIYFNDYKISNELYLGQDKQVSIRLSIKLSTNQKNYGTNRFVKTIFMLYRIPPFTHFKIVYVYPDLISIKFDWTIYMTFRLFQF